MLAVSEIGNPSYSTLQASVIHSRDDREKGEIGLFLTHYQYCHLPRRLCRQMSMKKIVNPGSRNLNRPGSGFIGESVVEIEVTSHKHLKLLWQLM
jgi:hypothetical protein